MDKYEYKVRAEEIKSLIEQRKYPEAMAIADTIDWRKVKSVSMLCDISDLYNVNRKFEVARNVLELAYERHPEGRRIVYSLCELSIKMEDIISAVEYYKEFVKIAPRDSGRYILQYKIYQAQEVGIDECIAVLKELKKRDYREKWAYELAYLYHRAGLATECVEECDELILWFGDGTFVKKAMELKMLHSPLSLSQKEKYELMNGRTAQAQKAEKPLEPEIRVKPVDTSIYNTMNLQKELAMSLEAVLNKDKETQEDVVAVHGADTGAISLFDAEEPKLEETAEEEEILVDLSLGTQDKPEAEITIEEPEAEEEEVLGDTRIFHPGDLAQFQNLIPDMPLVSNQEEMKEPVSEVSEEEPISEEPEEDEETTVFVEEAEVDQTALTPAQKPKVEAPSGFEELLSQEYDGQISLVVPEEEPLDKQITGQLSIEDVLAEWERMKRENEQKRQEEVRQRVLEHTGNLLKEFDENVQENLENFEQFETDNEEEETFEELEEIIEEDDEEETKKSSHIVADLVAGAAVVGAGVAAAGMEVAAKAEELVMEAGVEGAVKTAEAAASVAGTVAEVIAEEAIPEVEPITSEEPKRMPYGANRFEYEEEESTEEEPKKPVTRIVQDYNELLYGEDDAEETSAEEISEESTEETSDEELFEAEVEEIEDTENTLVEKNVDTEEEFDPQDFLSGMFETEDETQEAESKEVETEETAESEEEAFDFEGGFDYEESSIEDEPEQAVESEEEAEEEFEFNPESYLTEDSAEEEELSKEIKEEVESEGPEENFEIEEEISGEEETFEMEVEIPVEEASQEEVIESKEEAVAEPEDDISKRMEALASKVLNPSGTYVPKEEPLADTFTVVTDEMREAMMNPKPVEPIEEPEEPVVNEVTEEPVVEEQIPIMPMVTEAPQNVTVLDTFEAVAPEQVSTVVEQEATEAITQEAVETQETPTSQEVTANPEAVSDTVYNEDQYSKALEEQLSSVMPAGFTGIDENTFEKISNEEPIVQSENIQNSFEQVEDLGDGEEAATVENFYERQAEIERSKVFREFTETEERLYGGFLRTKKAKEQLIYAIDNISMASYTGNIIITGDDQKENLELARNLLKEVQQNDSNFSGVPGKISADSLNRKDVESILQKVENGAVIIENAGSLSKETIEDMASYLEKENRGIIVILIDHKIYMDKMLSGNPALRNNFNARIDIEEMTSQELSAYGKTYAYEKEYAIDEMGMLALFTKIEELQTMGHVVMPEEVEKIIDLAIKKANKKNFRHFTDIIINKRYDEEDMIVLREKDF